VRVEGVDPLLRMASDADLATAVADEVKLVRHRHHNSGVVAPEALFPAIAKALDVVGLHAVDRVHDLGPLDVPVFHAEAVKGLEFDGVVVVNPHEIFDGSERGARLLYVAMTRAVQVLHFVSSSPLPLELTP
jgi:superfamily I DNA/RNA helicase